MIEITATGAANLAKALDAANARESRALSQAMRIEGMRLMRLLREEIRKGAPGGRQFAPLSVIAAVRRGRYGGAAPLRRLASVVRYRVQESPFQVHVGFVDPGGRAALTRSWLRIARVQQEGFWHGMDETTRANIIRQLKYAPGPARRYFALRQSTRRFHTPARPIIEPFWRAHQSQALTNIRANYRRKIAGQRI